MGGAAWEAPLDPPLHSVGLPVFVLVCSIDRLHPTLTVYELLKIFNVLKMVWP
jgi:hypothetical protein